MFTGLIKDNAKVLRLENDLTRVTLVIDRPTVFKDLENGESLSVDGVCLTVEKFDESALFFFVSEETLSRTRFSVLKEGEILNLERSLTLADRIGGHLVSGHIDGIGEVQTFEERGEGAYLDLILPNSLMVWVVNKGSIAINGVSLTVNTVDRNTNKISIFLIPETIARTNLKYLKSGDKVNVECDQVVKIIREHVGGYGAQIEHNP